MRFFGLRLFPDFVLGILMQRDETGCSFGGTPGVEGEKSGENLVFEFRGPIEPRFGRLSLVRVLLDELRCRTVSEVIPAVGAQHGLVHFGVERAQAGYVGPILPASVEAVVGFGQALITVNHHLCPEHVIDLTRMFEPHIFDQISWKWKIIENIAWVIRNRIRECCSKKSVPYFMYSALQQRERRKAIEWKYN